MEKTHELLAKGKVFRADFNPIASMNEEEPDKTTLKSENRNRNKENRRQIIDFIADNGISDSKSISKAIGLKPSNTSHQVPQPNNALFLVHKIKNIALFLVHIDDIEYGHGTTIPL